MKQIKIYVDTAPVPVFSKIVLICPGPAGRENRGDDAAADAGLRVPPKGRHNPKKPTPNVNAQSFVMDGFLSVARVLAK